MGAILVRFLSMACLFGASCAMGATKPASHPPSAELRARLDREAPEWLRRHDVPSVAVAYIEDGKVAWTTVHGEQSPGVAANARTLYNVASLTKPVSAELILRLATRGALSLDEPIAPHWIDPDVADDARHKRLTARLCLSHQTGFTNWRYQTEGKLVFQWTPGTRTGYSGEGYDYVAHFAEKKLDRPFEALAQEYVFDPIGMRQTAYTRRDWFAGRLAVPRGPKGETEPTVQANWTAADLLRTTIDDYARFVVSVMRDEGVDAGLAAQRMQSTRNLATQEQLVELCAKAGIAGGHCRGSGGMGLGWEVLELDGRTIIDHSGSDWGVRTLAFFDPERRTGVVVFTNGDNGQAVIREAVALLYPYPLFLATL
jgi:CubicO group peptidase (beta-lactamase class C family)